jgi:hypothetical protein
MLTLAEQPQLPGEAIDSIQVALRSIDTKKQTIIMNIGMASRDELQTRTNEGGQMKRPANFMSLVMALSVTTAIAQTSQPPPAQQQSQTQQQPQTQQETQAKQQQNSQGSANRAS